MLEKAEHARCACRRGWPADGSFPFRMLLTTDGSVTALVEASFGDGVAVETYENAVDQGLLRRTAVLRLASDGRPLLRAVSKIELDCPPASACAALLDGRQPVGTVLHDAEVET